MSDVETIEQLRENPYLQYFCGFQRFERGPAFAPTLFVKLRERLTPERFAAFEQAAIERMAAVDGGAALGSEPNDPPTASPAGGGAAPTADATERGDSEGATQSAAGSASASSGSTSGALIIDASVTEQRIRYPNDVGLVAEARQSAEGLIDVLWTGLKAHDAASARKPRTYREAAQRAFTAYSKQGRRAARREQLQYLRRNLGHIDRLLDAWEALELAPQSPLAHDQWRRLWVIREVYRQQALMHRHRTQRVADRIVSLDQSHVRPIVRGRLGHPVEFGSKFSVSLVAGIACVDALRWDAFNEAHDLRDQCEAYRNRHGHYPAKVFADGIYGTRANRRWLKDHGIAFGGKPLGRPPKRTPAEERAVKKQRYADACARIPIEGKFGQGKGAYGLGKIAARRANTSEAWVRSIFLVMNLLVLAKALFWLRFSQGSPDVIGAVSPSEGLGKPGWHDGSDRSALDTVTPSSRFGWGDLEAEFLSRLYVDRMIVE